MTNWLTIMFQFNVNLLLLAGLYYLLRKRLSPTAARWSILLLPLLAALPLLRNYLLSNQSMALIELPEISLVSTEISGYTKAPEQGEMPNWPLLTYLSGVLLLVLVLMFRLWQVRKQLRKTTLEACQGAWVGESSENRSYSFFNQIRLQQGLEPQARQLVLEHELCHVKLKHSYDVMYWQLISTALWFNPVVWLLGRELELVHEYQVDEQMHQRFDHRYLDFMVAYALGTGSLTYHPLMHSFFKRKILLKRMKMMKKASKRKWAYALAMPMFSATLGLVSWTTNNVTETNREVTTIKTEKQTPAEFKGGMMALQQYLMENLKYPKTALDQKITGKVFVSFEVDENGKIGKVNVKKGVHPDLDAEAQRVIQAMPDWNPAQTEGKTVKSEMVLPIAFQL